MICKVCGYESDENFSVCPYCGNEISSQNQYSQDSFNQNNQNNQYNPSQYQTLLTKPNPENNQYNNYEQNQPSTPVPVARHYKNYDSNMPNYFREGWKCSFEIDQNEIRMERFLNAGDFVLFTIIAMIVLFIVATTFICPILFFLIFILIPNIAEFAGLFSFIFLILLVVLAASYLGSAKITVNSSGITIKTLLKEYFMPKEKIDSIICRTVTRSKGRYGSESFYDVFIVMKDKSVANKHNLDTGLCYKNKIHVDYLIDMFNERLGFL